jgi:hypothetical protein
MDNTEWLQRRFLDSGARMVEELRDAADRLEQNLGSAANPNTRLSYTAHASMAVSQMLGGLPGNTVGAFMEAAHDADVLGRAAEPTGQSTD